MSQPVKVAISPVDGKTIRRRPPKPIACQTYSLPSLIGCSHHLNPYLSPCQPVSTINRFVQGSLEVSACDRDTDDRAVSAGPLPPETRGRCHRTANSKLK